MTVWFDNQEHCAAALMLSFKILDMYKSTDTICAAFFKVKRRLFYQNSPDLMEKDILSSLREKLFIAESNILKVIKYEFNILNPNVLLQEKKFSVGVEDKTVIQISKLFILDIYRTGASLFYKPIYIVVAAFMLSHFTLKGSIFPKQGLASKDAPPQDALGQKLEDVHFKNFPPAYFFRLPSFKTDKIAEQIEVSRQKKKERTVEPVSVPSDFQQWLDGIEPGLNLNKVWEIIDLLNEALRRTKTS